MKRGIERMAMALLALVALAGTATHLRAAPFSQTRIILEINASAGDGGIQIFLDAPGWNRLEVFDPSGQRIFDVSGAGGAGMTGLTELFFESAEPSFQDLPLHQLLARFPEGQYQFEGTTVDGKRLTGRAALRHGIPAGPRVVSPVEGSTQSPTFPLVIDWDPVLGALPGTASPVNVVGYQVIVERVKPQPLVAFSVHLPATVSQVTVPAELLQANADYRFEVLAIEESLNQTITEGSFKTAP